MVTRQKATPHRKLPVKLTADCLLQGAYYALEQAGYLLQDARVLYGRGRYASSFALAVLGREEIGRARIYQRKRRAVLTGNTVNLQSLKAELSGRGGHVRKITASQQIIGVPVSAGFLGDLPVPGSPEERELLEHLDQKRRILEEQRPKEAQQRKLRALYVDHAEDGPYWLRPIAEITHGEADLMLEEAELQYMIQRRKLLNPTDDPELKASMKAWHPKPSLPALDQ